MRRSLAGRIVGATVRSAEVVSPHRHLIGLEGLPGLTVSRLGRLGKVLLAEMSRSQASGEALGDGREERPSDLHLVVHLGMSGRLLLGRSEDRNLRVLLDMEGPDGAGLALSFVDPRRFGRMMLCTPGVYPTLPMLGRIGPDPDALTPESLAEALGSSRRAVKAVLLDQRVVAGVGNIYADEALHRAGLAPSRSAASLSPHEVLRLHTCLREVVAEAVEAGGTTFRDYRDADGRRGGFAPRLRVYGRSGEPCLGCGGMLLSGRVAARASVWCPSCQPDSATGPTLPVGVEPTPTVTRGADDGPAVL